MVIVQVGDFHGWRAEARSLIVRGIPPEAVWWRSRHDEAPGLPFASAAAATPEAPSTLRMPRAFVALAERAADHRDPLKWSRLYRLAWRIAGEGVRDSATAAQGSALLEIDSDPDVRAVKEMADAVGRDEHKMRAFVRFAPATDPDGERFVAWYEPDHLIVRRAAPFFADRFSSQRWSILTPDLTAHWDGATLSFGPGAERPPVRSEGGVEDLWRAYYAAVFNPARANLRATLREMPLRRWARLPEAALIPSLLAGAHESAARAAASRAGGSARDYLPEARRLEDLQTAAAACQGCDLYRCATQVVFGEGPADARMVLVGEQPGDAEDLSSRPFVGPAGRLLDRALAAAGVDRRGVYVTNAVKHFAFEERGKRRIHRTPRASEVRACRPWLEAELQAVRPAVVVCLGATAARALLGPQARVGDLRGRAIAGTSWADRVVVTIHPSAILRTDGDADGYFDMLIGDLRLAAEGL